VARELPFGPVKVANVDKFLIPLGCETTNSKVTFVFVDIKSRSFGVIVSDSITGLTFPCAGFGEKPTKSKSTIIRDFKLYFM
jgi:hypothetical protein